MGSAGRRRPPPPSCRVNIVPQPAAGRCAAALHLQRLHQDPAGGAGKAGDGGLRARWAGVQSRPLGTENLPLAGSVCRPAGWHAVVMPCGSLLASNAALQWPVRKEARQLDVCLVMVLCRARGPSKISLMWAPPPACPASRCSRPSPTPKSRVRVLRCSCSWAWRGCEGAWGDQPGGWTVRACAATVHARRPGCRACCTHQASSLPPAQPSPFTGIDLSPYMIAVGRHLQRQRQAERAAAGQPPERLQFLHGAAFWLGMRRGGRWRCCDICTNCLCRHAWQSCWALLPSSATQSAAAAMRCAGAAEDTRLPDGCMDLVSIMLVRLRKAAWLAGATAVWVCSLAGRRSWHLWVAHPAAGAVCR